MLLAVLWLLLPLPLRLAQDPAQATSQELRGALDAMRAGAPGEAAFDAAALHLPALIRSRSPWWVAGSAWLAGEHRRRECIPDLIDALAHENRRPEAASASTKGHLLDALLRLDVTVPAERLTERLESESLAETYLLLARAEELDAPALTLVMDAAARDRGVHWAAACLLVEHGAKGLAARLLHREPFPVRVTVRDPGASLEPFDGRFSGIGSFGRFSHASWPPHVLWDVQPPRSGAPLDSATGRRRSAARRMFAPRNIPLADRLELRARLVDQLLGACPERGLLGRPLDLVMHWTTPSAYERSVRTHLQSLSDAILSVAQRLETLGRLKQGDAALARIVVRVEIEDERAEKGSPLPEPPPLAWVEYIEQE